ncbi:MAG: type I-B CRISPR-associated protein Cas5b [Chitinophagaceae bacterium]
MKLISFDLKADFAFFRKPDTNATINLSYNIIHRPAVLGILGAIIGLEGYKEKGKLPQYYEVLKEMRIGIEPLNHDNGNYAKTDIKYSNTVGYANKGTNFLTEELTLINPAYRIFLLLDENNEYQAKLLTALKNGEAEYIPYLGKNEFTAWWDAASYREYTFQKADIGIEQSIKITTIFLKDFIVKDNRQKRGFDIVFSNDNEIPFLYFERLPCDFDLSLMQYDVREFAYSTFKIKNASDMESLYYLENNLSYVQLL